MDRYDAIRELVVANANLGQTREQTQATLKIVVGGDDTYAHSMIDSITLDVYDNGPQVSHSQSCDIQSYGDNCIGTCPKRYV